MPALQHLRLPFLDRFLFINSVYSAPQYQLKRGSTGMNTVMWIATRHFFKSGLMLVLHVGDAAAVLDLLKNTPGE